MKLITTGTSMAVTRRTALAGLFTTLALNAVPKALAQLAETQPLSKLPRDAITMLPPPKAEYEGKMLVDLPGKPNIHPRIKAKGIHQRYDWTLLFVDFTCWVDIETGETIIKAPMKSPASYDLPLPTHYLGIPMKKIGEEEMFDDKELASAFEVKNAPIMKDRIFTGKFFVLDDGTVVGVSGQEKNVAKNGKFTDVTMKMTEFHRGPQKADVFPPPFKKSSHPIVAPTP